MSVDLQRKPLLQSHDSIRNAFLLTALSSTSTSHTDFHQDWTPAQSASNSEMTSTETGSDPQSVTGSVVWNTTSDPADTSRDAPRDASGDAASTPVGPIIVFYFKLSLFVVGFVGNSLTVLITRRTKTPVTTRIIITALALSDTLHLIFRFPSILYVKFFHKSLSSISAFTCKYTIFFIMFFAEPSVTG